MFTFSDRLRWAMAQMRPPLSRRQLAERIKVSPQSIDYLCNPNSNAKGSKHTAALAKALGVSPMWLATGEGTPYSRNRRPASNPAHILWECIAETQALLGRLEHVVELLEREKDR
ncbi:helix-turn-helix domain-containing protein [Cupriavidus gilardii]|uniref:helix-turn-helix domain-containing protein n=1 Tax=Cupriavidus gilardii TaxID=82541 RepID=UPI0007E40318|nr:helix-turn-helix domain-containing protein [Cupriavidus gilardii]